MWKQQPAKKPLALKRSSSKTMLATGASESEDATPGLATSDPAEVSGAVDPTREAQTIVSWPESDLPIHA